MSGIGTHKEMALKGGRQLAGLLRLDGVWTKGVGEEDWAAWHLVDLARCEGIDLQIAVELPEHLRTARQQNTQGKGSVLAAKAVEHAGQRQCLSHEGSGRTQGKGSVLPRPGSSGTAPTVSLPAAFIFLSALSLDRVGHPICNRVRNSCSIPCSI